MRLRTKNAVMESVLADLIDQHRKASRLWTPAIDGLEHEIARDIHTELVRTGLTDAQADYLTGNIL